MEILSWSAPSYPAVSSLADSWLRAVRCGVHLRTIFLLMIGHTCLALQTEPQPLLAPTHGMADGGDCTGPGTVPVEPLPRHSAQLPSCTTSPPLMCAVWAPSISQLPFGPVGQPLPSCAGKGYWQGGRMGRHGACGHSLQIPQDRSVGSSSRLLSPYSSCCFHFCLRGDPSIISV